MLHVNRTLRRFATIAPSVERFPKNDCSQLAASRAAAPPIRETDERRRRWDAGLCRVRRGRCYMLTSQISIGYVVRHLARLRMPPCACDEDFAKPRIQANVRSPTRFTCSSHRLCLRGCSLSRCSREPHNK